MAQNNVNIYFSTKQVDNITTYWHLFKSLLFWYIKIETKSTFSEAFDFW